MLVAGGSGVIEETVPEVGIEGVAFTFKDSAQVFAAFDGDLGTIVRGAIAAKGIVVLERLWDQGFRIMMTSTHPIRTVADMQGVQYPHLAEQIAARHISHPRARTGRRQRARDVRGPADPLGRRRGRARSSS